jgi:uncharacterized membrane protein
MSGPLHPLMLGQSTLVLGAPQWMSIAVAVAALFVVLLFFGYRGAGASLGVRATAAALKAVGIGILALCLLDPLISTRRARPGANGFVVLADNSQSMTLKDSTGDPRSDQLKHFAGRPAEWLAQLGRDFELRSFAYDSQLKSVEGFEDLKFDGRSSDLAAALDRLTRRYQGRPLAGVLVMTDGNATDAAALERLLTRSANDTGGQKLPPIYPVLVGRDAPANDVALEHLAVTQTNFEDAPVTISGEIMASGYAGRAVTAELLDESGKSVEQQKVFIEKEGQPTPVRFKLKPEQPGLSFYTVRVAAEGALAQFDHPQQSGEATLANNARLAVVDRGRGPFRVLYIAGRPNWEYKFLSRSVASDDQIQLVGLIRVARREPKFAFLGNPGDKANPLFQAFGNDPDDVAQYDQPVLVRLNTADEAELRGGFPKTAEDLFAYHAVIIDDVESEFFTQDQLGLLKNFVRQRGGGLLMMGGEESFHKGKWDATPVGDVLPVYADQVPDYPPDARFRMALTREGWLEPWVRLQSEEQAEQQRLAAMPEFATINPVRGIKPGATVLARALGPGGESAPALVDQRFGQGRAAAMLIGDLWEWELRRPDPKTSDMEKAWRQVVRWLVADVPQRVEATVDPRRDPDDPAGAVHVAVQVRDSAYAPLDNATVDLTVTGPDGKPATLRAEPSAKQAGRYEAMYVPRDPGGYRARASAAGPDGKPIGEGATGWSSDPAAEEFADLRPNAGLLDHLARATGGKVVNAGEIDAFVKALPEMHAEITEPVVHPLWHQSWVFLLAIAFLAAEWGLRRWRGLP